MKKNSFKVTVILFFCLLSLAAVSCATPIANIEETAFLVNLSYDENEIFILEDSVPLANAEQSNDPLRKIAVEIFDLCNKEREKEGLEPFKWNESLYSAAQERAEELGEKYSHTRPDNTSCFTIFDDYELPFRSVGENIAIGQSSAEAVVKSWMLSEGHKANITGEFEYLGVGVIKCPSGSKYAKNGGYAFAQLFYVP